MKVLVINGSPRLSGCTDRALREVEATLQSEGVEIVLRLQRKARVFRLRNMVYSPASIPSANIAYLYITNARTVC